MLSTQVNFGEFAQRCGIKLELFQSQIHLAVNGPQPETVVLLPRGNSKTSLEALEAVYHLSTVEDAQVYVAAASEQQASILFEFACSYVRRLKDPHIVIRHHELRWCPSPDDPRVFTRHLRVRASDAPKLHGLVYSLAILDELQAMKDDSVYIALASALHKRAGAKLVVISTAGQGTESPLGRLRSRALAQPQIQRDGPYTDAQGASLRFLEWAVPEDADINDPEIVKLANPASWISEQQLATARETLPELAYRRFVCNQWTEREGHWLPPNAWNKCITKPTINDGEEIFVGVDIGGQRSSTGVAWVTEDLRCGAAIFFGESGVLQAKDLIEGLAERYQIVDVLFDPWRAGQIGAELEERGITVHAFPQNDSRMCPASVKLHSAIVEQRIQLPDYAALRQQAANAVARQSRRGWRIDKPHDDAHIDGIIALAMAVDAQDHQPQPTKFIGWI